MRKHANIDWQNATVFAIVLIITLFFWSCVVGWFCYRVGVKTGVHDIAAKNSTYYNTAFGNGVDSALDTCNKIIQNQMKSDTSATRLKITTANTYTYILSRKTILPKK